MAIETRFGSPVVIVGVETMNGNYTRFTIEREDGSRAEAGPGDLKADGGWAEIVTAADAVRARIKARVRCLGEPEA